MSEKIEIKAVIIDDSAQARKLLSLMLLEYAPEIKQIGEATNVDEGLIIIEKEQPDAIFLDIEMPGKTGLQLAKILLDRNFMGSIVFTTAYNSHAITAFRLSAIDYLLKPIREDQLVEAVAKLLSKKEQMNNNVKLQALTYNLEKNQTKVLCLPLQEGNEYIPLEEIIYLEADGSYVRVNCSNGRNRFVSKNLKYFENILEDVPQFLRTHRSYLINMSYVAFHSKSEGNLFLKNGVQIPISRERKQNVNTILSSLGKRL
jgi:two-component system LytT family response regulator